MKMNEKALLKVLESYTSYIKDTAVSILSIQKFRIGIRNKNVCLFNFLEAGNLLTQVTN